MQDRMPSKMTTKRRILWAIVGYVLLAVVGAFYFTLTRDPFKEHSALKPLLALGGPSLSLFTHMSYPLFLLQSLLLLPWLLLGAVRVRLQWLAGAAFAITWLLIGWRMVDLF
jgi:hypothetical protein